jgi:hypothetical protein
MRKKFCEVQVKAMWVLPFFLFTFLPLSAQKLVVSQTTVECGRTGYQQPITATFQLRNKSLRRLVIESVKPDCGCTAVEFPKEVGANDKFTIKMTYDARQLGHFQKMAVVKSNGSTKPVYLTMKGVVLAEVLDYTGTYPLAMGNLLLDKDDLEFDDVNKGDAPVQEIHILNNSMETMTPRLMHLPSYLNATYTPETLAPGKSGTIAVTLRSDLLRDYGLTQTQVFLAQQLGEKVSADKAVGVTVTLLPDLKQFEGVSRAQAPQLQISETTLDFTDFQKRQKKTIDVKLSNTGQSTLTISSMQMYTSGLKVTLDSREIAPGQTTTLKVTGFAEELAKVKGRPRILMITNDPDHAKVIINIKK